MKLERKLIDELRLLSTIRERVPDCPVALFSDVKFEPATRAALAGLAYDLGARYVLFPPLMPGSVEDLAEGLMESTLKKLQPDKK